MLYERNLNLLSSSLAISVKAFDQRNLFGRIGLKSWFQNSFVFSRVRGTVSRMRGLFSPTRIPFSHCRAEEWIINRLLTVPQTPENWRNYLKVFALFSDCGIWSIFGVENLINLAICPPDCVIQPTREQLLIFGNMANLASVKFNSQGKQTITGIKVLL